MPKPLGAKELELMRADISKRIAPVCVGWPESDKEKLIEAILQLKQKYPPEHSRFG